MTRTILYVGLIAVAIAFVCASTGNEPPCGQSPELHEQCNSHTYSIVKPLLDHLRQNRQQILEGEAKDKEIKELQSKLIEAQENAVTNSDLRSQIAFQQTTIDRLTQTANTSPQSHCEQFKADAADKAAKLAEHEKQLRLLNDKVAKSTNDLQQCQSELVQYNATKVCGRTAGIYPMRLPGLDVFNVLCDTETAGPGWLVIEQRINGAESFNRDWATFRKGFGRFDGDFFLGLEKIHRLTISRFHELYIHMERFDGRIDHARYERFLVGNESDKYRLHILGDFSGNVDDKLKPHSNMQFSTLDSDNDSWAGGSCAKYREAGWWYDSCVHSFLHGTYFQQASDSYSAIYFNYPHSLRKLKIMMRPTV